MPAKSQTYTVEGRWPFPLDMLRHDDAKPATAADETLIQQLAADHCESPIDIMQRYQVNLVRVPLNRWNFPNGARWKSFSWNVVECTS